MRRLGFGIACGLLLAGTAAQAQVGAISESASTTLVFPFKQTDPTFQTFPEAHNGTYTETNPINFGGSDFSSFVNVGADTITFESSNVSSGIGVRATSSSSVAFDFTNSTGSEVNFNSVITAAGLGFYLADVNGACRYSNCIEVAGPGADLGLLTPSNPFFTTLGLAGFDFSITDGETELYRVTGELALKYVNGAVVVDPSNFLPVGGALKNFGMSTDVNDAAALGYSWDATPVSFLLGQGLHHLTYSTRVYSWSQASSVPCGASLVAFSGFGDPIGQSGSVENVDAFSIQSADFGSFATTDGCSGAGPIEGVNFTPTTFGKPVFKDGVLTFGETDSVPEPATWAMMILGFGSIGAMMRRRRLAGGLA